MIDYNEEARKLFANLDGSKPSRFNNLDPIYRSEAGGFIYVGGDLSRGVTAVVNCTTNIDCFHTGSLDYFTFDVAFWRREVMGRLRGETQTFIRPVLEFINDVINRGQSVLVHCLAGAHRAGTTGLSSVEAISVAKNRRPIIEPIGDFKELLAQCDRLRRGRDNRFLL